MSTENENPAPRRGRPRKNSIDSDTASSQVVRKDAAKAELKQATIEHVEPIESEQEEFLLPYAPEIMAEPVLFQEAPPCVKPDLFLVYQDQKIVGVVEEGSEPHLFFEASIASQMAAFLEDAKRLLSDQELLLLNVGRHAARHKTWSAYFVQNGLAPQQPKYRTILESWRAKSGHEISDEQLVARFRGKDFTYHVVPLPRIEAIS